MDFTRDDITNRIGVKIPRGNKKFIPALTFGMTKSNQAVINLSQIAKEMMKGDAWQMCSLIWCLL